jgi:hypothetical protein
VLCQSSAGRNARADAPCAVASAAKPGKIFRSAKFLPCPAVPCRADPARAAGAGVGVLAEPGARG